MRTTSHGRMTVLPQEQAQSVVKTSVRKLAARGSWARTSDRIRWRVYVEEATGRIDASKDVARM
jgi:hypothetical protein